MGLFDFLWGGTSRSNVEIATDRIWMNTTAKFDGLAQEAQARSHSDAVAILLVAHFPDVLKQLTEIVQQHTWDVPCKAVLASDLTASLAQNFSVEPDAVMDILVGERHPIPSVDNCIREFGEKLPCRCRVTHHVSLDDAVIRIFAGDWVKNILQQLGMTNDSAIQSDLVSKRIRQAQQKIEDRTFSSLAAESAEEWLLKNCPNYFPKRPE
jgi:hypothetical protein